MFQTTSTERRAAGGDRSRSGGRVKKCARVQFGCARSESRTPRLLVETAHWPAARAE